jgi:outer membrane lipoprotein carrier protein
MRQTFVSRFAIWCVCLAIPAFAADGPPDHGPDRKTAALLKTVENRYNHADSLKLDFSETYTNARHPVQRDSGILWLRKPGRMRWEYSSPPGKVFLSDGKDTYLYLPDERRAEKSKLKQSDDMRAPLAFLLGKLDFNREFKSFQTHGAGPDIWLAGEPKSPNLAYTKVEFLATPEGEIRDVRVTGQDQSKLEFVFSNEQRNVPAAASLFVFRPPPGVEVVEAEQ